MTMTDQVLQGRVGIGFDGDVQRDAGFHRALLDDRSQAVARAGQEDALAVEVLERDRAFAGEA